jgi:hypothetical protein
METTISGTKNNVVASDNTERYKLFNLCLFLTGCVLWFGWGLHFMHLHGQLHDMGLSFYDLEHSQASTGMIDVVANAMAPHATMYLMLLTVQLVCLIPLSITTIALLYLGLSEKVRENVQAFFEASDRGDFTKKGMRNYTIYVAIGSMVLSLVTGGYIQTGLYLAVFLSLSVYSMMQRSKSTAN